MTDRQRKILAALAASGKAMTAADIAYAIGISRGPWSGYMSPAQHVIGSLTGLRQRGLVDFGRRPDGRSGTAYSLTDAGRAELRR